MTASLHKNVACWNVLWSIVLIWTTILGLQIDGNTVKNDACSPTDNKIEQSNTSKYTIEQILDKASDFIDMYNYEMAQKFCQRALEIDNDNVRALETTATLLLEVSIKTMYADFQS